VIGGKMIKYSNSVFNNAEEVKNFVRKCEENFEFQLQETVNSICLKEKRPFITLAGPTCSGKTTAAKKIVELLKERFIDANIISIDDFYYDTKKLKELSYQKGMTSIDYDSIDTIDVDDLERFVEEVSDPNAKEVHSPIFDFNHGKRVGYRPIKCSENSVFIFEGIQALYPRIQEILSDRILTNIYICTQSSIEVSGKVFEPNDIRFLRRLVRDYKFRSTSPEFTFQIWNNVRKNEDESIFPYAELCEIKIDSVFACEISLLKPYLVKILSELKGNKAYGKAAEDILNKISDIEIIKEEYISKDSLYREFI
jgi:uridine kinase